MQRKIKIFAAIFFYIFLCGCGQTEKEVSNEASGRDFDMLQAGEAMETAGEFENVQVESAFLSDAFGRELAAENMVLYQTQAQELCALINDYRRENGLNILETDDILMQIAMHRASENAYTNWMETVEDENGIRHLRPDGSGIEGIFRSYDKYGTYGEILGRRQQTAGEVFEDWKSSPQHDACMKKEEFEQIGVGIARAENGDFYYAVVFLREIQ